MKVKLPSGLDKGIENEVRILMENGIETFESCEDLGVAMIDFKEFQRLKKAAE